MNVADRTATNSFSLSTETLFAPPKNRPTLSTPEAIAEFLKFHEPRIRDAIPQTSLLAKWDLGEGYNFARHYRIDRLLGSDKPLSYFFFDRFHLNPQKGRQEISIASQIAIGLQRTWIEASPQVSVRTASQIVKGDPPLAEWICWILYKEALLLLKRSPVMAMVQKKLYTHLLGWGARKPPTPEELISWIHALRAGEELPKEKTPQIPKVERRSTERDAPPAEPTATFQESISLSAISEIFGQKLQELETRQRAQFNESLLQLEERLEHKFEIRLTEALGAKRQGEAEGDSQVEEEGEVQGPPPPVAATPEPAQAVVAESAALPNLEFERPTPIPARKPGLTRRTQELLPIPYPMTDPSPSGAEKLLCSLIVVFHHLIDYARYTRDLIKKFDPVNPLAAARSSRLINQVLEDLWDLSKELKSHSDEGAAYLQEILPSYSPFENGPVPLLPGTPFVPLDYLIVEFFDPTQNDQDRSQSDEVLYKIMTLLELVNSLFDKLSLCLADDPIDVQLAHQFAEVVFDAELALNQMRAAMRNPIALGQKDLNDSLLLSEQKERERKLADASMIVLGDDYVPNRYVKIGLTGDGRYVALSLSSPQFLVFLGSQGFGKTHLAFLLAEGASLALPGLSQLGRTGPSRVWTFVNEWRRETANRQALYGLYENPIAADLAYLREVYGYVGNVAHSRIVAVVLPGTRDRYLKELPELIERGLEIVEGRLHPDELTANMYTLLLTGGAKDGGKEKPRWLDFIEQVIAKEGRGIRPSKLKQILIDHKVGTPTVFAQLDVIETFLSDHEHLASHLSDTAPRVVLQESTTISKDLLLPMQIVMMGVLRNAVVDGQHLILIQEEGNKALENLAVQDAMVSWSAEVRHQLVTTILSGQTSKNIPHKLWALVTGGAIFHMPCPKEYKALQDLIGAFQRVPYETIRQLGVGQSMLFSTWVSDRRFHGVSIPTQLRPSCLRAAGETRNFA